MQSMTVRLAATAALLLASMAGTARAETVLGRLELLWGDPVPAARAGRAPAKATRFTVTLVTDEGRRLPLDPRQALEAADDLYALSGRQVAVELEPSSVRAALPYRIDAIVHAGQSAIDAGIQAVLGTTVWRTVMCKFADIATEQRPLSFFQSQYGDAQGQLDHYWREVSYGKVNLAGSSAHGWFTLPQPRSYYIPAGGSANLNALFDDCTAAATASVDFAAGGGVQGINMMFNGDLDGYAWGGGRCAVLDGVNKCWSTTWNPPWSFNNLSPMAHEMGHGYGLPHANNSDGDSDPYDNPWDVMSSAWNNAASDPVYGSVAKHINMYHRDRLGWVDAARKVEAQAGQWLIGLRLERAGASGASSPQMIVVRRPGDPASRYWTVETRRRAGYYESALAGNAVIIHEVNTSRQTPAQSVDADVPPANLSNNEGSMFKPGETWTAPDGSFRIRVWREEGDAFLVSVCGPRPAPAPGRKFDMCNAVP